MTRIFSHSFAFRLLAISTALIVAFLVVSRSGSSAFVPPPSGVFYTVTGTADNTDAVIQGGTGTSGDPYQMSSVRGAVLNANTMTTSAASPATISVPAGTYLLSVDNPNTPGTTGTINLPDLEIGSATNRVTTIVGTGGMPTIQQTVSGNDVITTGFDGSFAPVPVALTLQNLAITGGTFSGIFTGVDTGAERSSTTLINCNVHDNSDSFFAGGGIFNQTGDLTVQGCTFANNTTSQQGGAIFFDLPNSNGSPGTFGSLIITDSTFSNNTASASNNIAGGAIAIFAPNRVENTYSITGSTFINNHANGTLSKGGGIASGGTGTLNVTLSRFFGNTATGGGTGVAGQGSSPINAINNWWGCDNFPGSTGCDTVSGTAITVTPRLDLVLTGTPGCASTALKADFSKNSAGASVAPTVLNGLTVNFAVVSGPAGSAVSPTSAAISSFMASSSLTATVGGTATVSATLDNGTQNASADIDKAVAVSTNPTNQTVCDGGTATFSATASGNPAPTVQWEVSTNGGGSFGPLAGATNPILSFTATAAQNGNQYRAVFTNTCEMTPNTATTTAATLTVNTAPSVSTNPTNQMVCDGAMASFTAAANGSPAPTVQWQVSSGGPFTNIPGATSATLSFTAATSQNGNQYRAVFTNSCSTATTTAATLTINAGTTATVPSDQTVCQGVTANFSTTASGTGPFTYQWKLDGSNIAGATGSTVNIATGSLGAGNHTVDVVVSGACGSVTKSATLTVNTAPVVTLNPMSQSQTSGNVNFTAAASGSPAPTVQWQVSTNGGTSFSNIPGATSTTLTVAVTPSVNGNQYRAVFTNACASATTTAATLTTCSPPVIALSNNTLSMWPPNHTYRTFNVTDFVASATSNCFGNITSSVIITRVTSDETENGNGDGNTLNDIVIAANCKSVQLRSERNGGGDGRVYTIMFRVTDAAGNVGTATARVTVPLSQNGTLAVDSGPSYTVNSTCP
ncbi:MAG: hypothetical protein ACREA9_04570 [Pyrinomonadaceae bacterium]